MNVSKNYEKYKSLNFNCITALKKTKSILFTTESECISWLQDIKTAIILLKLKKLRHNELTKKSLKQKALKITVSIQFEYFIF